MARKAASRPTTILAEEISVAKLTGAAVPLVALVLVFLGMFAGAIIFVSDSRGEAQRANTRVDGLEDRLEEIRDDVRDVKKILMEMGKAK